MKSSLGLGRTLFCATLVGGLAVSGCAEGSSLADTSGGGGGGGSSVSSGGEGGLLGEGGSFIPGGGGASGGDVYVNSLSALYRFDPIALKLTFVGQFNCVLANPSGSSDSGMHDIAVDKNGQMFGVAKMGGQSPGSFQDHVIVSIDKTTGNCSQKVVVDKGLINPGEGVEIRGLSFVPAGTLDPSAETLVALEIGGAYLKIDLASKSASVLGHLNGNGPATWFTKGADIVSIIDEKTYVTATQNGDNGERLAIMDPLTGSITQSFSSTGIVTIGGLAYWGGTLYAFTVSNGVYALDPATGVATAIVVSGAPSGLELHGAGVTTAAPLTIPK